MGGNSLITGETMREHRARWFVYVGGERVPHVATMRGHWPGWDAVCKCGWDSGTGGATKRSVEDDLFLHRWSVQCEAERSRN
jgi:hypothetical protein